MQRNGKLVQEARKRGYEDVTKMVSAALSKSPSVGGAAAEIGVAPNALTVWLNTNGYAVIRETKARLVRADSGFPVEGQGE